MKTVKVTYELTFDEQKVREVYVPGIADEYLAVLRGEFPFAPEPYPGFWKDALRTIVTDAIHGSTRVALCSKVEMQIEVVEPKVDSPVIPPEPEPSKEPKKHARLHLTYPQWKELLSLKEGPQRMYGRGRARVQRALYLAGYADYTYEDGRPCLFPQVPLADFCVITPAGLARLDDPPKKSLIRRVSRVGRS